MTFDQLATRIIQMQTAFREAGLDYVTINLASWKDGQRLSRLASRAQTIAFAENIGPANEINIAGTIIRWPAIPLRRIDGEVEFL